MTQDEDRDAAVSVSPGDAKGGEHGTAGSEVLYER